MCAQARKLVRRTSKRTRWVYPHVITHLHGHCTPRTRNQRSSRLNAPTYPPQCVPSAANYTLKKYDTHNNIITYTLLLYGSSCRRGAGNESLKYTYISNESSSPTSTWYTYTWRCLINNTIICMPACYAYVLSCAWKINTRQVNKYRM